ncbi:MAG: GTPase HflX, partial [Alphaproteobacteria bacterium]|nr:GTPase HflX [Alphaproteobacteria bacterium]
MSRLDTPAVPRTDRALVIHPAAKSAPRPQSDSPPRSLEARLDEAVGLARAIDLDVVRAEIVRIARPAPGTLFGSGNVEMLRGLVADHEIGLVVVDGPLSPVQQRNL